MDRKAVKVPFTPDHTPDWMCPTCAKGILRIKDESFSKAELASSRDHSYDEWEPYWIRYVYSCLLECSNSKCKEVVTSTGTGGVDASMGQDERGEWYETYEDYFEPKYFEPPLHLFRTPAECPESVAGPIKESFRLLLASPDAAANAVRAAVEQLLTELKIKRYTSSNGKRRFISLHQRIALLPGQYAEIRDLILAIKWIGNIGSHSRNELTVDDVLDAYEFLEHVLEEIYGQKTRKLKSLAKKINRKGGPIK